MGTPPQMVWVPQITITRGASGGGEQSPLLLRIEKSVFTLLTSTTEDGWERKWVHVEGPEQIENHVWTHAWAVLDRYEALYGEVS